MLPLSHLARYRPVPYTEPVTSYEISSDHSLQSRRLCKELLSQKLKKQPFGMPPQWAGA